MDSALPELANPPCNLGYVTPVCATAPAPHIHLGKSAGKLGHLEPELFGITIFEMTELAEIERLHRHGVREETAQTAGPVAWLQASFELGWVGAVDHVVGRRIARSRVIPPS